MDDGDSLPSPLLVSCKVPLLRPRSRKHHPPFPSPHPDASRSKELTPNPWIRKLRGCWTDYYFFATVKHPPLGGLETSSTFKAFDSLLRQAAPLTFRTRSPTGHAPPDQAQYTNLDAILGNNIAKRIEDHWVEGLWKVNDGESSLFWAAQILKGVFMAQLDLQEKFMVADHGDGKTHELSGKRQRLIAPSAALVLQAGCQQLMFFHAPVRKSRLVKKMGRVQIEGPKKVITGGAKMPLAGSAVEAMNVVLWTHGT